MASRIAAVFWDMDGTLIDSEPLHERAMMEVLDAAGVCVPDGFHDHVIGQSARSVHGWLAAETGLLLGFEEWVARKYARYLELASTLQPREGALDLFHGLDRRSVPQVIVSNSDRIVVDANIRVLGLGRPEFRSIARNDVREGKPDPEGYLRAAWLAGVEPGDAVVVEDSITGARAGLAAGIRTLFWPQAALEPPAGVVHVTSLETLAGELGLDR